MDRTTAVTTARVDGWGSPTPDAGRAANRKTARPPVVRAAPISSCRSGACRLRHRPERQAHDQRHGEHRLHDRDRSDREGGDLGAGPGHGGGLAEHPPLPLHQQAQAQPAPVRRGQLRRLVLQDGADRRTARPRARRAAVPAIGFPGVSARSPACVRYALLGLRAHGGGRLTDTEPVRPRRCPCGTGLPLDECCGPLHDGTTTAATAEQLMRSRYSAFAVGDPAYLLATWHPTTRPADAHARRRRPLDRARRAGHHRRLAAERRRHRRVPRPLRPRRRRTAAQHERSRFVRDGGRWHYLDGVSLP